MALVTAAQARLALPGLTGTGEDTNIGTVIARVGAIFARWCGYPPASAGAVCTMESTSYTLYSGHAGHVDVLEGRYLRLRVWPVTAISAIYDDPNEAYGTAVTASLYEIVDGNEGLVRYTIAGGGAWSEPSDAFTRAIKVSCTAGFSTVPADLEHAAVMMTKHLWNLRHTAGKSNVNAGQSSAQVRDEEIPAAVREVLGRFRLPGAVW